MFFETTSFRSLTDMVNFNLPSELLTFNNWTLIHGKSFFLNFAPGSIAIGPLDFSLIYKTILGSELFNLVLN
jgi:hypothetical protein